jgi:peptide/nickel transport system permease protein
MSSMLIAIPMGVRLAMPGSSAAIRIARICVDAISSIPVLVWCTLLFVVLARGFGVIPGDDRHPLLTTAVAVIALLSGDRLLAELVQRVESATRDTLQEPYMRTVRAGGFGVRAHLARSLVSPIATAVLSRAMFLVSGAIIIELIFDLPGLGSLIRQSLGRATPDPKVALAATMALIAFGTVFRATRQGVVWLVDRRVHR